MNRIYFSILLLLRNEFSVNKAEGLRTEKIIGGNMPDLNVLKYTVAVMYDPEIENMPHQNPCAGAIISNWHISTVAHCFYDKEAGQLRNKRFYVIVDTTDIWDSLNRTIYAQVDLLYVHPLYEPDTPDIYSESGNLAIIKLVRHLGLRQGHQSLKKIRMARELYVNAFGFTVSAYGWNDIMPVQEIENGEIKQRFTGSSDGKLRMATGDIINGIICQKLIGNPVAPDNICVKIRQTAGEHKGICYGDSGAPLVRSFIQLVGIAIHGFGDCNENRLPGIYVNVPHYLSFFTNILDGNNTGVPTFQLRNTSNGYQFFNMEGRV